MKLSIRYALFACLAIPLLGLPLSGASKSDKKSDDIKPVTGEIKKAESTLDQPAVVTPMVDTGGATVKEKQPATPVAPLTVETGIKVPADAAASGAGEQINWQVIASGGGLATSTNFLLNGTLGQTVAGAAESPSFRLNQGYWQNFVSVVSCCQGTTGNVNDDPGGNIDLSDLIFLVNYLFLGGAAPACFASANVNGDAGCNVDLSDLIYLVNFLFLSGTSPAVCLPACE